jgi:hypothetical protein
VDMRSDNRNDDAGGASATSSLAFTSSTSSSTAPPTATSSSIADTRACGPQVPNIVPRSSVPRITMLAFSTSERAKIRAAFAPYMTLPSEWNVVACKENLAKKFATETDTCVAPEFFKTNKKGEIKYMKPQVCAHLSDPIGFVDLMRKDSDVLIVGGDKGGLQTKLGVTVRQNGKLKTFALWVYNGSDSWQELANMKQAHPKFSGATARLGFKTIFEVLQYIHHHDTQCVRER